MYGVGAGSSQKQYALGSVPRGRPWDEFKPKTIGRKTTSLGAQKAEARRREEEAMSNPWQTSAGSVGAFVPAELVPPPMAHPSRASREARASDALGPVDAQRERANREALVAMRERKARPVEDGVRWAPKSATAPASVYGGLSRRAPPAGFNGAEDDSGGGGSSSVFFY